MHPTLTVTLNSILFSLEIEAFELKDSKLKTKVVKIRLKSTTKGFILNSKDIEMKSTDPEVRDRERIAGSGTGIVVGVLEDV